MAENELINESIWLALCIYFEARGETKQGQVAVGHVILNRVNAEKSSVKDVVLRPFQFSWANGGSRPPINDYQSLMDCVDSALACFAERLSGKTLHGSKHYHVDSIDPPYWAKGMRKVEHIGHHIFYV